MTREQLEKIARQKPFRPFVVELTDGSRIRVRSPENLLVSWNTLVTLDAMKEAILIDFSLIADVHVEPEGEQGPEAWMMA